MKLKPYYEDESVQLFCGDFREVLPQITAQYGYEFDLACVDPPYGETSLAWDTWPDGWPSLIPGRSMWCFGSMRMFLDRRAEFDGWKLSQDVVWEKNTTGMNAGDRFSRCHEHALHWYRGDWRSVRHEPPRVSARKRIAGDVVSRGVVGKGAVTGEMGAYRLVSDGLSYQRTVIRADSTRGGINETEKPAGLVEQLITYGAPPQGLVLDVFAGGCSTLVAARNSGRRAVGIELREEQCALAVERRLSQAVLPFGESA